MKHKLFTLLLAMIASVGTMFAETYSGSCGENLTWSLNTEDSVLTISGTGLMESFNNISDPWYVHRTAIKSAIIGSGVTSIGNYAFKGCSGLTSVTIPNSVTSIGWGAFEDCSGLTAPVYNAHVFAFMPTSYSGAYTILDGIESIAGVAFSGCSGLTSVTIPNSVTSIGEGAFSGCTGLTSVTIPYSVTSIGDYAFNGCSNLNTITNYATIPQPLDPDGFSVFGGVPLICTLYVPAESVASYQAADVWKDFYNILPIEDTPEPCIIASGTCGAEGDNLAWKLSCDSVLTISGTGAMADYSSEQIPQTPWNSYLSEIKSVVIEEGATNIGRWAFGNCTSLTSVEIPNSVTSIGNKAFCNCSGLTSVTMPNSVTSIGTCAFENCTGLTSVTIPNSVTSIGNYAFKGCSGLTSVTIPNSVTSIGWGAFEDCSGLTAPVYNAHVFAFMPTSYSGAYTILDGIESIAGVAFSGCSGLTSVTIPNSVTSIGWGAFRFCSGLTSVTIPDSVTSIGEWTFIGCTALTSVTIPNSVTSIGNEAFYYCTGLTSVTNYSITPQTINANAFASVNLSSCTLYVPAESIEAYKTADVWKEFGTILPIGGQPIEPIEGEYNVLYVGQEGDSISSEEVTLHLPVAPMIEGFLFVGWQTVSAMLTEGIIIQAVYQAKEPTSAPAVYTNPANPAQKLIRNGNVYILTDDKIYSITGQTVR